MATSTPVWPGGWEAEIRSVLEGTNPLGPRNDLIKKVPGNLTDTFHRLSTELVENLVSTAPASEARALLRQLNFELRDADKSRSIPIPQTGNGGFVWPSFLPLPSYTAVLEYVAAKTLWEQGHHTFLPWPFDGTALKPDFLVLGHAPNTDGKGHDAGTFYTACDVVADTLKVGGHKTVPPLAAGLYSGVVDKLTTYAEKEVHVVLDAWDNPCLYQGTAVAFDREAIISELAEKIAKDLPQGLKARLRAVYVNLPDGSVSVLTFRS